MLHVADLLHQTRECGQFGIHVERAELNYTEMLAYRDSTVESLRNGVSGLLKSAGVTCIDGRGQLLPRNKVLVHSSNGELELEGGHILLAMGSKPKKLPIPGIDLPHVFTSDGMFALDRLPISLTIIGGGAIGVEFAEAYSALGVPVTLLEAQNRLLPGMDRDFSQNLRPLLKKRGVYVHLGAMIQEIRQESDGLICHFTENDRKLTTRSEYVLCAVGRTPNTEGLFAPGNQPKLTPTGHVVINENLETSLPNVYAFGDLIPGLQLAHAASAQGRTVAELIAGRTPTADLSLIPACVYTTPEIAQVGLTEQEAKAREIPIRTAKVPMTSNPRSQISRSDRGFMKLVADSNTGTLLGAQLMCDRATDIISEFTLALSNHLTVQSMLHPVRSHPTFEESLLNSLDRFV